MLSDLKNLSLHSLGNLVNNRLICEKTRWFRPIFMSHDLDDGNACVPHSPAQLFLFNYFNGLIFGPERYSDVLLRSEDLIRD